MAEMNQTASAGGAATTSAAEVLIEGGRRAAGDDPQYVTRADFDKVVATVNSLPGLFHRKISELKEAPPIAAAPSSIPAKDEEVVVKIRQELDRVAAKNAAKERTIALREVVSQLGLDEQRGKLLRVYVEKEHGDKIKNGDDGEVFVDGVLGAKKPLSEFVTEVLKQDGLEDFFKPPSKVPAVSGAWHGTGRPQGTMTATFADLQAGRVNPDDVRKGKVVIIEG